MRVQETVKKETVQIAVQSSIATIVMWLCIFILHRFLPEKVNFDYRVILSGLLGTAVAVTNFFLMGVTVQGVLSVENQEEAYQRMRLSYRNRTMLQLGWIILAVVAPCFQAVAGIVPLLFPGGILRIRGVLEWKKGKNQKQGGEN
ncbi:hypothetical protein [Oribacterium sp. oral taxon 108]|uniref:hypothetical protein n=1 Tax=Oribacterium sp. oral taxon 108 TaxID=712414 RepID=UPI00020DD69D|nr:hypothetical protein [Oribacterium sp. oral taxon 108]EGL37924.1 hypothetical protein HMPREF9124_1044 [Oribacterium sp. oral taxon 108 str. F0425]